MKESREKYVERLKALKKDIATMGVLVDEALVKALKALTSRDVLLAEQVISEDDVINAMEVDIEDKSIALIATEQPVAGDLRNVITGMKIVTQLERMGDHAVHVAKSVRRLDGLDITLPLADISRMGEVCTSMIGDMLSAFTEDDPVKAQELTDRDKEVDALNAEVQRRSFKAMGEDESNRVQAVEFNYMSRCLERYADHITNISEWIVYGHTGTHVELNH